jgi:hypothetical protein
MEKEKLNRLSHWWREVETASDDEALQRKLHLMEAEIRHTLRGASVARQRQALRNIYAAGLLCAVLLLSLGVARMVPTTSALQYATTDTGVRLPAVEETTVAVSAIPAPAPVAPAVTSSVIPAVTPASAVSSARRNGVKASRPVPHSAKPQAPASAPPAVEPAAAVLERAAEPAKAEPEPGLDALALLSSLESEFEK